MESGRGGSSPQEEAYPDEWGDAGSVKGKRRVLKRNNNPQTLGFLAKRTNTRGGGHEKITRHAALPLGEEDKGSCREKARGVQCRLKGAEKKAGRGELVSCGNPHRAKVATEKGRRAGTG